jgi:predicted GIY-YIG superfamily endonuclease
LHYVYLLESCQSADQRYVGLTSDLKRRLAEHNAGQSEHTAKFLPWRLVTYIAFSNLGGAAKFERYLKSGSGDAFARRRLWRSEIDPAERFRKQVCFSSIMKSELRKTQRDVCTVCGMPLWNCRVDVHHLDYAHQCAWAGTVFVKVAGKEVEVPDCAECKRDDLERFEGCRKRLQLLHKRCHADYHAGKMTIKAVV